VRKVLEAKQVYQRVELEISEKRENEINNLKQIRSEHQSELIQIRDNLLGQTILNFLEKRGLIEKEGPFPDEQLLDLIPHMVEYPFDLSEDKLWEYAEHAFNS